MFKQQHPKILGGFSGTHFVIPVEASWEGCGALEQPELYRDRCSKEKKNQSKQGAVAYAFNPNISGDSGRLWGHPCLQRKF